MGLNLPRHETAQRFSSVIHCFTPISGWSSIGKLVPRLAGREYVCTNYPALLYPLGLTTEHISSVCTYPKMDHYFMFNDPAQVNSALPVKEYRMILTLRDPRDWMTSRFFNMFTHPAPAGGQLPLKDIEQCNQLGLDRWVLASAEMMINANFVPWLRRYLEQPKENRLFLSYNRLCVDTRGFIEDLAQYLGLTPVAEEIDAITTEMSLDNENGVRYRHRYSSPLPGRARRELKSETFEKLSEMCRDVLELMTFFEKDGFKELYS